LDRVNLLDPGVTIAPTVEAPFRAASKGAQFARLKAASTAGRQRVLHTDSLGERVPLRLRLKEMNAASKTYNRSLLMRIQPVVSARKRVLVKPRDNVYSELRG